MIAEIEKEISEIIKDDGLSKYDYLRITSEKDIPVPEPSITFGHASVATPGNITAISAAAKVGKTAVAGVILSGAISRTGITDGFGEDFKIKPNTNGLAVLNFDTEQSQDDQQRNLNAILRRANIKSTPDYYGEYNIRQLSIKDYKAVTDEICNLYYKKFGGIHMIVIDGGADYILSVNDEEASAEIIQFFTHLAIRHNCPVIVIVHQNPSNQKFQSEAKERGHFGSQIQRKCYGLLSITKDGDISTLSAKMLRRGGNDTPEIHFKYCYESGYHKALEPGFKENRERAIKIESLRKIAAESFSPLNRYTYRQALDCIIDITGKSERTVKDYLRDMKDNNIIIQDDDKCYRLVQLNT